MKLPQRVLQPRSIAVFGGAVAEQVIHQCTRMGYRGELWPVHPERAEIGGRRCFKSVRDLPAAPDAAFAGINRMATLDVVAELSGMGAGGVIAYASGFKEVDAAGDALQTSLVAAAGDMPVIGPNCYGIINYLDGALLWPDVHGGVRVDRGVAIITQSSNIGLNLTMSRRGVPVAYLITLGNQAMIGAHHVIETLVQDPRVSAIGLYMEGISDAGAFAGAVDLAHRRGIPVVLIKAGRTASSVRLTRTHTASLAGSDAVMDAYFRHLGVPRVESLEVLLETLKLLHVHGPLSGRELVSLSCSGGEASLMSDAARHLDLNFRPFTDAEAARIRETVNPLVTVSNPFDYHTFDWGKYERLLATFTAVMQCGFDFSLLVLDFPNENAGGIPKEWAAAWRALADAAAAAGASAGVVSSLPESLPEAQCRELMQAGLTPLLGIDDALRAVDAAAFAGEAGPRELLTQPRAGGGASHNLDEHTSKQLLAGYGVPIPNGRLCHHIDEVLAFTHGSRPPWVLKTVNPSLPHKTEAGGVVLNLDTEEALRSAHYRLSALGDTVLVEEMIDDGVAELIVGMARDEVVGLYLVVGAGGIFAETLNDSVILMLPTTHDRVTAAIRSLRLAAVYTGIRGRPAADIDAAAAVVMAVQRFALDHLTGLRELDINPLILRAAGRGVVAVDALICRTNHNVEAS